MKDSKPQTPDTTTLQTGSHQEEDSVRFVRYPFDRYIITVAVNEGGKFIGISEVRVNTDFMNYRQKTASSGYHDVEDYYKEEEAET